MKNFEILFASALCFFKNLIKNPEILVKNPFSFKKFLVIYNELFSNSFYHYCSYLLTSQEFEQLRKNELENLIFSRKSEFFLKVVGLSFFPITNFLLFQIMTRGQNFYVYGRC